MRLKHDELRNAWVLLGPERVISANPTAVEILKRCDGDRTIRDIVDDLAARFKAERSRVEADVVKLLDELALKRMIDL